MKSVIVKSMVLFSAILWLGCSGEEPKQMTMPPMPVHTLVAKGEDIAISYAYPAKLVSDHDVVLKAKVSGTIKERYFQAGDTVKKGQKLFLIDPEKYKAAANVAQGNFLVAKADYENAQKDHSRNEILFAKKAISQKEYDTSLATFNSAAANLESAKASYENAKIDLVYTNVEAPFDGVLGDALVNIGEFVSASSSDLVRITNLNPIYADFYISDKDKLKLQTSLENGVLKIANTDANISVMGKAYKGDVYFISSVIEDNSANVKAKALFDNSKGELVPGMVTTISMNGFIQKNGFKIPQSAVMQDQREAYVYTIEQGKVKKTPIVIAYQDNQIVIASKGLKDGEKIILDNFKKIRIGSAVSEVGSK